MREPEHAPWRDNIAVPLRAQMRPVAPRGTRQTLRMASGRDNSVDPVPGRSRRTPGGRPGPCSSTSTVARTLLRAAFHKVGNDQIETWRGACARQADRLGRPPSHF